VCAALIGAVPFLVLVTMGYNSDDLKTSDKLIGSLIVVVLPAVIAAVVLATATGLLARLAGRARRSHSAAR
jgi:Na+/melibiose symporter-like transporter